MILNLLPYLLAVTPQWPGGFSPKVEGAQGFTGRLYLPSASVKAYILENEFSAKILDSKEKTLQEMGWPKESASVNAHLRTLRFTPYNRRRTLPS